MAKIKAKYVGMATEKRLIDANEPIAETESIINFRLCHHMPTEDYESFLNYLKKQPTVDAVEVVRCKDCKHYSKDGIWCDMNSKDRNEWFNWYEDDFCSYGERRTDG